MFRKSTIAACLIALSSLAALPANAASITAEFQFDGRGWSHHGGDRYIPDRPDRDRYVRDRDRHDGERRRWQWVSPREARWILQDRGYHDIRFLDDRGRVYEVRARRHGEAYRLLVNARNGQIISRNRI